MSEYKDKCNNGLKRIQVWTTKERFNEYSKRCDQQLGGGRKMHIPLRNFINDFINGRIYLVDGVLHIREKK